MQHHLTCSLMGVIIRSSLEQPVNKQPYINLFVLIKVGEAKRNINVRLYEDAYKWFVSNYSSRSINLAGYIIQVQNGYLIPSVNSVSCPYCKNLFIFKPQLMEYMCHE